MEVKNDVKVLRGSGLELLRLILFFFLFVFHIPDWIWTIQEIDTQTNFMYVWSIWVVPITAPIIVCSFWTISGIFMYKKSFSIEGKNKTTSSHFSRVFIGISFVSIFLGAFSSFYDFTWQNYVVPNHFLQSYWLISLFQPLLFYILKKEQNFIFIFLLIGLFLTTFETYGDYPSMAVMEPERIGEGILFTSLGYLLAKNWKILIPASFALSIVGYVFTIFTSIHDGQSVFLTNNHFMEFEWFMCKFICIPLVFIFWKINFYSPKINWLAKNSIYILELNIVYIRIFSGIFTSFIIAQTASAMLICIFSGFLVTMLLSVVISYFKKFIFDEYLWIHIENFYYKCKFYIIRKIKNSDI